MGQTYTLSLPAEDREQYLKKLLDTGLQSCPFERVSQYDKLDDEAMSLGSYLKG